MSLDNLQVSIREHFEKQLEWVDRYFDQRLRDTKEAVIKAETALNIRLEGMNELRSQLKDQAATFTTRVEFDQLVKRLSLLEQHDAVGEGRNKIASIYWAIGASVITALAVLVLSKLVIK